MALEDILAWYSGKARETIVTSILPALRESAELGYWKKGVSRGVRAALHKQNLAKRWAKRVEGQFGTDQFGSFYLRHDHPLGEAHRCLEFGSFERAPQLLQSLRTGTFNDAERPFAQDALRWAEAFAPVAELVDLLDTRRPRPVFVMKTLSPTVAQNLSAHIGLDVSTIQSPPSHGEWRELLFKGKKIQVYEVIIDWPEGTQHNKSRFHYSAHNQQCQACGHAIKNLFNWVPILAYNPQAVPHALWVGRDCAAKLFGCEVEGDALYQERRV